MQNNLLKKHLTLITYINLNGNITYVKKKLKTYVTSQKKLT